MINTDILIIGAGPAGLGAAIEAAKLGAKVVLIDENERAGGQLYKQIHKFFGSKEHYAGARGFQIADILLKEAAAYGVTIKLNTRAVGLLDNGAVSAITKKAGESEKMQVIFSKKVIIATGAKENALAFKGCTIPGVMTAGAAQTFSNIHGICVGKKIVVVGSGNVGLIVAYQLMQAGAEIVALVEVTPRINGYEVHAGKIKRAGVPIYLSHTILEAVGHKRVEKTVITQVDEKFQPISGSEKIIEADTVLLAVGLTPRTELSLMFGCKTGYESALGGIIPLHNKFMQSSNPDVYVCGDIAGVEEASTALEEGRLAGIHGASCCGFKTPGSNERIEELLLSLESLRSGEHASIRLACKQRLIEKGDVFYAAN